MNSGLRIRLRSRRGHPRSRIRSAQQLRHLKIALYRRSHDSDVPVIIHHRSFPVMSVSDHAVRVRPSSVSPTLHASLASYFAVPSVAVRERGAPARVNHVHRPVKPFFVSSVQACSRSRSHSSRGSCRSRFLSPLPPPGLGSGSGRILRVRIWIPVRLIRKFGVSHQSVIVHFAGRRP